MNRAALFCVLILINLTSSKSEAGDFKYDTELPVSTLDKVVATLNRKAPAYENPMETITGASRDGRTLVEEIELTHEADDMIRDFSSNKLKQLIYDTTVNRYCNRDMKMFMDANFSIRLIFFLHGKEFYRVLQTPFSCTIVN